MSNMNKDIDNTLEDRSGSMHIGFAGPRGDDNDFVKACEKAFIDVIHSGYMGTIHPRVGDIKWENGSTI